MRKIYRLSKMQNNFSFILTGKGGNQVRYNFVGNVIANVPARLTLTGKYYQDLLESSEPFLRGQVVLERSIADASDMEVVSEEKKSSKKSTPTELTDPQGNKLEPIADVHTLTEAINYLASVYGETVKSRQAVVMVAADHGISFPNMK